MKHKKCGTKIIEWGPWSRWFVGCCPKCDIAVTKEECESEEP